MSHRMETKVEGLYLSDQPASGCLGGYFTASYEQLVELFGPPNGGTDEYKVSTEWALEFEDGASFRIYDYKETNLYDPDLPSVEAFRSRPEYDWHLGGPNTSSGRGIPEWVNKFARLMENVTGIQTRTHSSW